MKILNNSHKIHVPFSKMNTYTKFLQWCIIFLIAFTLSACGSKEKSTFQNTKDFYFTHINKPSIIDLNAPQKRARIGDLFANRFNSLDTSLTALERSLEGFSNINDAEQAAKLLQRYPWLSNVLVLNDEAKILGAIPPTATKPLNFDYLKAIKPETRKLYAHMLESPAGTEILIARPFIQGDTLIGYIAVAFDMRSLLPMVGDPKNVIIATPDTVLWSGDHLYSETLLGPVDWHKKINEESYGKILDDENIALWLVRYFADTTFIFGLVEQRSASPKINNSSTCTNKANHSCVFTYENW